MANMLNEVWEFVCNLLNKPINKLFEWLERLEPYWNFLVKHDKYVYLFLALFLIVGACL